MLILALDLAKSTGWAYSTGASGEVAFGVSVPNGTIPDQRQAQVFWEAARWVGPMLDGVAIMIVEDVGAGGGHAQGYAPHYLLGLRAITFASARSRNILIEPVGCGTWQAWTREAGYAWKKAKAGTKGGDEADARAMLAYWQAVRLPRLHTAAT